MASATADFERIYRRHARDVYRFALSVVRNPLEAEDVTQTTFLNAYRALERGDRPDRPRSWLLAIAHNAIRSRDRWRLRRPPEVPLDVAEYRLAAQPDDTPAVSDLLDALGDLPDAQRQALARRELQGQTYPEIAEVLGVSVSAVESLIARARRALRAQRERLAGIAVLRRLCEQGDGGVAGVTAKAAAVVAAATALAGGMAVETHVAGPPRADAATPGTSRPAEPRTRSAATPAAPAVNRASPATAPHATPPAGTTQPPAAGPASATVPAGAAPTSVPTQTTAPTASSAATQPVAAATTPTAGTVNTATGAILSAPATTVEPVTVPAVTVPAVTTPVVTTPAVTTPAVTTPTVTLPPPTVPLP